MDRRLGRIHISLCSSFPNAVARNTAESDQRFQKFCEEKQP
jgi:hypothetical protein